MRNAARSAITWLRCRPDRFEIFDIAGPLLALHWIIGEGWCQRVRWCCRNVSPPSLERGADRTGEPVAFKCIGTRQCPEIVEIFVSGVGKPKGDHCLKLLGDDGFARIGLQPGSGLVEQDRQVNVFDAGLGCIAETDIDDDIGAGSGDGCRRPDTQSAVFLRCANEIEPAGRRRRC